MYFIFSLLRRIGYENIIRSLAKRYDGFLSVGIQFRESESLYRSCIDVGGREIYWLPKKLIKISADIFGDINRFFLFLSACDRETNIMNSVKVVGDYSVRLKLSLEYKSDYTYYIWVKNNVWEISSDKFSSRSLAEHSSILEELLYSHFSRINLFFE